MLWYISYNDYTQLTSKFLPRNDWSHLRTAVPEGTSWSTLFLWDAVQKGYGVNHLSSLAKAGFGNWWQRNNRLGKTSQVKWFPWRCSLFQIIYNRWEGRVIESLRAPSTRLPAPVHRRWSEPLPSVWCKRHQQREGPPASRGWCYQQ